MFQLVGVCCKVPGSLEAAWQWDTAHCYQLFPDGRDVLKVRDKPD